MGNKPAKRNEAPALRTPTPQTTPRTPNYPLRSSLALPSTSNRQERTSPTTTRIQAPSQRTRNSGAVNMYTGKTSGARRRPRPLPNRQMPAFTMTISPSESLERLHKNKNKRSQKKVTFFDFKGLMAPVFTCFKNDEECSLDVENVDRYANWLKRQKITGVLVNSYTGEGSALGLEERKRNTEAWYRAAVHYDLIMMVQIGGAPLPDVIHLAEHAEELGVHAVLCLPELFYSPRDIKQLIGYCKIVAKHCTTRPFFYYHIPWLTQVFFDMEEFCQKAEDLIPNFFGIQFSCNDLEMGQRCLRHGRCVLLGSSSLLAPGMLLGFESGLMTILNVRPDMGYEIYNAMNNDDLIAAKEAQTRLAALMKYHMSSELGFVASMKRWFNEEARFFDGAGFSVGPARLFYEPYAVA